MNTRRMHASNLNLPCPVCLFHIPNRTIKDCVVACGLDHQLPTTNQTVDTNEWTITDQTMHKRNREKKSAVRLGLACKFLTVGTYLRAPNQTNTNANAHANFHSDANKPSSPPIHSLLKLDSLTLLLPPSPLSASPPAVIGESTDVGSRTSVGATVSARAADGVVAAHGAAA